MTNVGPQPPPTRLQPSSWQRWWIVVVAMIGALPVVLGAGAVGWLLFGIAGAEPDLLWGTVAWVVSAVVLAAGVGAPPGPARRARLVIGTALAVVWFVVERFVLGP